MITDKKPNLIIHALEVKPAYTLVLEELTELIKTTDVALNALCRYRRSSCEVEQTSTLVMSVSLALAAAALVKR